MTDANTAPGNPSSPANRAAPTPSKRDTEFVDRIATLRAAYAEQIPQRLLAIRQLAADMEADQWSAASVNKLITALHELAGSATTFGFGDIGVAARSLEYGLRNALGRQSHLPANDWPPLLTQVKGLAQMPPPDPKSLAPLAMPRFERPPMAQPSNGSEPLQQLIFIVDDNLLVAEQLAEQLRYFGHLVETFGRLSDFALAFRLSQPSLVVLDIDFPEEQENGPSMFGRLMHEQGTSTPVVFISSRDDIKSRLMAVRAGGSRYLVKPVVISELIDAVDSLLNQDAEAPYRVLIVDDTHSIAQFYGTVLQQAGMDARVVTNPLDVLPVLSEFQPDLALIDLYMPECSGQELAGVIRQFSTFVGLPIVFLSGETDRAKQLSAMQLGADDFLTKPIDPEHLVVSVRNRAARARQMRSLMKTDSLTGLLNHISFQDAASVELARAKRSNGECTIAMIDLDHFKSVNDTYGHQVGDSVLRSISRQLRQRLRTVDIIGRYGGEEFAMVLTGTDPRSALRVINSIREDFSRIAHSSAKGVFHCTFSCGVSSYPDFTKLDKMIEAADKGLYEAKRRGRNCAVYVTPPPAKQSSTSE